MHRILILLALGLCVDANIPCPNYWVSFGNSCYQFSTTKTAWFHAVKNCTDQDAHLVSIESQQENTFLVNTITQLHSHEDKSSIDYWTSGNDLAEDGTWIWGYPEGSDFSYTNWSPGEPNNYHHPEVNTEECMQLRGLYNFKWNDILCTEKDFFICEMEDYGVAVG